MSKARRIWGRIGQVALTVFLVGTITGCLVVGVFAIYVFGFVDGTLDFDLDNLNLKSTTIIYVTNEKGEQVELQRLHDGTNRIWADPDEISPNVGNAFIAMEDKRFGDHEGVDWRRTFFAFVNMFTKQAQLQGGSSITQQLVKNLTGDDDVNPMRKVQEIMRAQYLEKHYSKDSILTAYLNRVFFGNNCYGVKVAANYYFNKEPIDLTVAESCALASIVKAPTGYDPYINPENNKTRREYGIRMLYEQGYISAAERDAAMEESKNLKFIDHTTESKGAEVQINSYFVDTLIENITYDLMEEYGYSKNHAESMLYSGGLRIYSTLKPEIQDILEKKYKTNSLFPSFPSIKQKYNVEPESAMMIMDYSGHIVAVVGGRGEKTINRGLNRATQSKRQPGSSMKPLGVYAPALEYNLITYSSRTRDYSPTTVVINGVRKPYPTNYGGSRGTNNMVTSQYAIMRSLNTVPARILMDLGYRKSFDFVTKNLGITTLVESAKNENGETLTDLSISSLALGGPTYGLTVQEMTAAYATFGNLGKYYKPVTYTVVKDQDGRTVLEPHKPTTAMGEDTALIMNKMLQTVVRGSNGTGGGARFGSWPIYAKTGTTSENKDFTFYGGTPYYVAGVWIGFDTPRTMPNSGSGAAVTVWRSVMTEIHKNLKLKDFPDTSSVSYRRYCTSTGLLATNACESTALGWFKNSYLVPCTTHPGRLREPATKPAPVKETSSVASTSSKAASSSPAASSKPPASSAAASSAAASSTAPSSAAPSSSSTATVPPVSSTATQPPASSTPSAESTGP